jgi:FMN phosphatase YigB (HAD superfamily)
MSDSILLDCDDVLLDWIGGFRQYAATRLQHTVTGEPQSWNMGDWLGTTNEVAFELIEEFNASPHFGRLEAVEGSQRIIEDMHVDDDVRLHVITSCSSDAATVALRRENLELCFGKDTFDSIHCLDLGQSKLKILQAWAPGALWIEDNYKNAMLGIEAGHTVLIRKRPHNKEFQHLHDERLTWFGQWSELGEI